MRISRLWAMVLMTLMAPPVLHAQRRALTADTPLHYCAGESAIWRSGTTVTLDGQGLVMSGVLARDTSLRYCASESAVWQAGTTVTFRNTPTERCCVLYGTLASDTSLRYAASSRALFKGGTTVTLQGAPPDIRCRVRTGTLAEDTGLFAVGKAGTPTPFKAGTQVRFDAEGQAQLYVPPAGAGQPLTGRWAAYRNGRKVGDCSIRDDDGQLVFVIHRSPEERSSGRYLDARTVVASEWGPQRGRISEDGRRIDWDNSHWERVGGTPR